MWLYVWIEIFTCILISIVTNICENHEFVPIPSIIIPYYRVHSVLPPFPIWIVFTYTENPDFFVVYNTYFISSLVGNQSPIFIINPTSIQMPSLPHLGFNISAWTLVCRCFAHHVWSLTSWIPMHDALLTLLSLHYPIPGGSALLLTIFRPSDTHESCRFEEVPLRTHTDF